MAKLFIAIGHSEGEWIAGSHGDTAREAVDNLGNDYTAVDVRVLEIELPTITKTSDLKTIKVKA